MWLIVMFDLPVTTRLERKHATKFRNRLLDMGFEMSQFSIYLKYCHSSEKADSVGLQIKATIPDGGKVDILTITDKQFSNIVRIYNTEKIENLEKPQQLQIF